MFIYSIIFICTNTLQGFGTDYIPDDELVFTFATPGDQCVNISLLEDDAIEGDHEFGAVIDSTYPDIAAAGFINITIVDINSKFCNENISN